MVLYGDFYIRDWQLLCEEFFIITLCTPPEITTRFGKRSFFRNIVETFRGVLRLRICFSPHFNTHHPIQGVRNIIHGYRADPAVPCGCHNKTIESLGVCMSPYILGLFVLNFSCTL